MSKINGVGKVTREHESQFKPYTQKQDTKKPKLLFAEWLNNPQYNTTGPISFKPASNSNSTASGVN